MKLTVTTLIAALFASTASVALAQREGNDRPVRGGDRSAADGERPRAPRQGGGGRGPGDFTSRLPLYKALDKDGNGELSEAEIKGATLALLELDADKNGILSAQEIMPTFGARGAGGGRGFGGRDGGAGRTRGGADGERPQRPQRPQRPATEKTEPATPDKPDSDKKE